MLLLDMVESPDVDESLEAEITEECSKYGLVDRVVIYQVCKRYVYLGALHTDGVLHDALHTERAATISFKSYVSRLGQLPNILGYKTGSAKKTESNSFSKI